MGKNNITAVEWLVNEFELYYNGESELLYVDIIEQAKQMEKEQMKKTWKDGFSWQSPYKNFEQYYNETYKK